MSPPNTTTERRDALQKMAGARRRARHCFVDYLFRPRSMRVGNSGLRSWLGSRRCGEDGTCGVSRKIMNRAWRLIRTTIENWIAHKDARQGAALAYYSVFSVGPLMVIAVGIAGLAF